MKKFTKNTLLLSALFFSLPGCAEEPSSVVNPIGSFFGTDSVAPQDEITVNSLVFAGSDFFGQACELNLSMMEENGEHVFLSKLNYKLHGQTLPSLETNIYRYDVSSNSYDDAHAGQGSLAIAGAIVDGVDGHDVDLNQLADYERHGELEFSLRIDLGATDLHDFEEALEEVIADPTVLAQNTAVLNNVSRAIFKIAHAGHYDAAGCVGFQLSQVKEVTYSLDDHGHDDDHDDDGDDHDHDHDHDHD